MSIEKSKLEQIILNAFPGSDINVVDTVGDSNHYDISITSEIFSGMSLLKRHRFVNEKLKSYFDSGELHAASFKLHEK